MKTNKVIILNNYRSCKEGTKQERDEIGYEYFKNDPSVSSEELQDKRVKGIFAKLKTLGFTLGVIPFCISCAGQIDGVRWGTPGALAVIKAADKEEIRSKENMVGLASVSEDEKKEVIKAQLEARGKEKVNEHTAGLMNYLITREKMKDPLYQAPVGDSSFSKTGDRKYKWNPDGSK